MLFYFFLALTLIVEPWLEKFTLETLLRGLPVVCSFATLTCLVKRFDLYSAVLSTVLSVLLTPAMLAGLVLFGGSLVERLHLSILAAAHISVIGLQPFIFTYGLDSEAWSRALSFSLPFDDAYLGFLGAFVGAWLGAVPIVLDWDRTWQEYPITIVVGAYLGSSICGFYGAVREKTDAEIKLAAKLSAKAEKSSKVQRQAKKKLD
ncbi:Glycosylphosphatidylinositol anchor biosynthesis protein 11 [Wickerhamiella sorbophila]|uniref:Glycosylphosphatidylinositol anchor biosynthesis protein 11 n=1 Tax=Wickerhamiella sorbophila TaxID=45607 RepID=A0A2T0FG34_9ASCO|nr:Glycosylphosphatidylinositol anchor biosynthesis protein 11 [Wickerhamiella sorbophila]PRT53945.1 Glycosylphosphatidylinositol anchor biosynthesis protein 11 [Wickerhamiella sorbophila]